MLIKAGSYTQTYRDAIVTMWSCVSLTQPSLLNIFESCESNLQVAEKSKSFAKLANSLVLVGSSTMPSIATQTHNSE